MEHLFKASFEPNTSFEPFDFDQEDKEVRTNTELETLYSDIAYAIANFYMMKQSVSMQTANNNECYLTIMYNAQALLKTFNLTQEELNNICAAYEGIRIVMMESNPDPNLYDIINTARKTKNKEIFKKIIEFKSRCSLLKYLLPHPFNHTVNPPIILIADYFASTPSFDKKIPATVCNKTEFILNCFDGFTTDQVHLLLQGFDAICILLDLTPASINEVFALGIDEGNKQLFILISQLGRDKFSLLKHKVHQSIKPIEDASIDCIKEHLIAEIAALICSKDKSKNQGLNSSKYTTNEAQAELYEMLDLTFNNFNTVEQMDKLLKWIDTILIILNSSDTSLEFTFNFVTDESNESILKLIRLYGDSNYFLLEHKLPIEMKPTRNLSSSYNTLLTHLASSFTRTIVIKDNVSTDFNDKYEEVYSELMKYNIKQLNHFLEMHDEIKFVIDSNTISFDEFLAGVVDKKYEHILMFLKDVKFIEYDELSQLF